MDFWQNPKVLGRSQDVWTVPKTPSPNMFYEYIIFIKDLRYMGQFWDLGVFGRVPRSWDVGTVPKTQNPDMFKDDIFLY